MALKEKEVQIVWRVVRQVIYFGLVFAFIFQLHFFARIYGADTFEENGMVENVQLSFLILSACCFGLLSYIFPKYRTILLGLASCSLFASCRELDSVFDRVVPIVHWKFAYLFPIIAVVYAWRHWKETKTTLLKFFNFPAFYMLYLAGVIILPLAQCIGHGSFVRAVLHNNVADIKEFFEESMETVGYFIILLSSVEMAFNLKNEK